MFNAEKVKLFLIHFFLVSSTITILSIALFLRPIQDDYFALASIRNTSLLEYLESIWNNQGGNLFPYLANSLVLFPLINHVIFIGHAVFYLLTIVLVCISSALLYELVTGQRLWHLGRVYSWLYLTLACFSFEGFFVPSFIGAFSFGTASVAHLWPVLLMTISIHVLLNSPRRIPVAIVLGICIGNANAGESFTAFVIALITLILIKAGKISCSSYSYSVFSLLSIFLGILAMLIAPGFSNRATNSVGLPNTFEDFFFRLARSFISFFGDSLTHPGVYFSFFIGVFLSKLIVSEHNRSTIRVRLWSLVGAFSVLFLSLVFGGALAYVSWHQAFGLQFLLMPISFFTGTLIKSDNLLFKFSNSLPVFLILTIIISVALLRMGSMVKERASVWDISLARNVCVIQSGSERQISGAELVYPPMDLGIEDVQSWDWLENGYREWLKGNQITRHFICD